MFVLYALDFFNSYWYCTFKCIEETLFHGRHSDIAFVNTIHDGFDDLAQ